MTDDPSTLLYEADGPEIDARHRLITALQELPYNGGMIQPSPNLNLGQTEVAFLNAVTGWLIEFRGILAKVSGTNADMRSELDRFRRVQAEIRWLLGAVPQDST